MALNKRKKISSSQTGKEEKQKHSCSESVGDEETRRESQEIERADHLVSVFLTKKARSSAESGSVRCGRIVRRELYFSESVTGPGPGRAGGGSDQDKKCPPKALWKLEILSYPCIMEGYSLSVTDAQQPGSVTQEGQLKG